MLSMCREHGQIVTLTLPSTPAELVALAGQKITILTEYPNRNVGIVQLGIDCDRSIEICRGEAGVKVRQ